MDGYLTVGQLAGAGMSEAQDKPDRGRGGQIPEFRHSGHRTPNSVCFFTG